MGFASMPTLVQIRPLNIILLVLLIPHKTSGINKLIIVSEDQNPEATLPYSSQQNLCMLRFKLQITFKEQFSLNFPC